MTSRRRSRARARFLNDQGDAAAAEVTATVEASAARAGRALTQLDDRDALNADPLTAWFLGAYLQFLQAGLQPCPHLDDDAPQPRRWDSADPGRIVCQTRCTGLGADLQLRAAGLLPARCGRRLIATATLTVDVAVDTTQIVGRICAACMITHSPSRGGAA